jgi:hypothetical protein
MWKLPHSGRHLAKVGRAVKTVAAVAGLCTVLAPSLTLACDDDYREPTSWGAYPAQQPTVVVVDPRDQYDRYEHGRRERAARAYWYWRGRHREHEREYRHHRSHWD